MFSKKLPKLDGVSRIGGIIGRVCLPAVFDIRVHKGLITLTPSNVKVRSLTVEAVKWQ